MVAGPADGRRHRRVSDRQARRLLQQPAPGGRHRLAGGAAAGARVAHQRLVRAERVGRVAPGPADTAEVLETGQVAAEVGALLRGAHRAQRVLQVRVDLHLQHTTHERAYVRRVIH